MERKKIETVNPGGTVERLLMVMVLGLCLIVLLLHTFNLFHSGNRMLRLPAVPKDRVYKERFKNVGIIFSVLKASFWVFFEFGVGV